MRLGEIKQIVKQTTNSMDQVEIDHEAIFGNQAFVIKNFEELKKTLEVLKDCSWVNADYSTIKDILIIYEGQEVQLGQDDFNKLNGYVSSLNQKFPMFYSILKDLVEPQDEQIINIKLPNNIGELEKLSEINKRLDKLFKVLKVDGSVEFKGFDTGTDWYVISVLGIITYTVVIKSIDIAKKYFDAKKSYYESKSLEYSYKASLKKEEEFKKKDYEKHLGKTLDKMVEDEVETFATEITDTNGKTTAQLQTDMVKGVMQLISEMGDGVEFHLSLNPPEYAKETVGGIQIDYSKVQSLINEENKTLEKDEIKEIETKESKPND